MQKRKLALGIVISLASLGLAVVGIEWSRVGRVLREADWRFVVASGVALLGALGARAARWRLLLGSRVGLGRAFAVTNIGYLVSNVLPFRLGDPARAVALGLDGAVKVSTALSTVVVERVLDMLTVVALLAVTLPFVGEAGWTRKAGMAGVGLGAAALALLTSVAVWPAWWRGVVDGALERLGWLDRARGLAWFDGLAEGVASLGSPRQAALVVGWSGVIWALTVGYYVGMLGAFIERPSLAAASFLTSATAFGVALPSSPGAVGVFHSVARYALELPFGIAGETAVVVAFASHAVQYVVMCALGLGGLLRQNVSLGELRIRAAMTGLKE